MSHALFTTSLFGAVVALIGGALAHSPAPAPSEVVVTASRGPDQVAANRYGGSLTVFTADDLATRQTRTLSDILRDAPGVAVSRLGGPGAKTELRLRGAESNHTLVLIDGIEASDPFQGEFDFGGVIVDDVARIEILRGPQSALYGSDAIGGAIQYFTLSGSERPGVSGRLEAGSFGAVEGAARAAGVRGPLDFAVSGAFQKTEGLDISGEGGERDGARTRSASARLGYALGERIRLRAVGRYVSSAGATDPGDPPQDGLFDRYRQIARSGLVGAQLALLDGRWTHDLSAQVVDVERRNLAEPLFGGNGRFDTDGRREKFSYVSAFAFEAGAARNAVTLAFDHEEETFQTVDEGGPVGSERATENRGYVAQYALDWGPFSGSAAARRDENSRFAESDTYRLQASLALPYGLRARAAVGTGVKAPTNFELFGFDPQSFIGDPNLKPEASEGWEAGLEARVAGGLVGVAYFESEFTDEIVTRFLPGFVATVVNLDRVSTQEGVEAFAALDLPAGFRLTGAYTWLDAEEAGREEVRRPKRSGSATLSWRTQAASAFATVRRRGGAADDDFSSFPARRVSLAPYTLVDLGGEASISRRMALFARIENATDERYEDVFGYASLGRAGYVGVRAGF